MRWPVTWRNKCARRWPIPSSLVCTDWAAYQHTVFSVFKYTHNVCVYIYWLYFVLKYMFKADIRNSWMSKYTCVYVVFISGVTRILEPVKEQMHQEIAQKLTATDSIIRDSIGKMVRSKVGITTYETLYLSWIGKWSSSYIINVL